MSRQAIEFFLAKREDLARRIVKFGFPVSRLRTNGNSDDPLYFKARAVLGDLDGVEKVINEFFGHEACIRFIGVGSLLDHVKNDNIRVSKLAKKIPKNVESKNEQKNC